MKKISFNIEFYSVIVSVSFEFSPFLVTIHEHWTYLLYFIFPYYNEIVRPGLGYSFTGRVISAVTCMLFKKFKLWILPCKTVLNEIRSVAVFRNWQNSRTET